MSQEQIEQSYLNLPVCLQNLICSIEGWRIRQKRFGNDFPRYLKQAQERSSWSHEKIIEYRNKKLKHFLIHCKNTVLYYKNLFKEIGFNPNDTNDLNHLQAIPTLKKKDVQSNYSAFISDLIPKKKRVLSHTSGTTGSGMRFATTLDAIRQQWAIWWRYWHWHGIQMNTWCGYFGGRLIVPVSQKEPPFWRYNFPGRQVLFSGYHMSPDTIKFYIEELRKRKLPWLHGYPSLITLLANYLIDKKEGLGYQLSWITLGAESLLAQQAEAIEKAFGIRPIQHYGLAEGVANFSQCEKGTLHVDEDFAAVEFLPNEDGTHNVVGTNFSNLATPFLRYETGDVVTLKQGACPCGKPGRLITNIDGRIEDYVTLKNGTLLGRLDHIFKDMINLREVQIYQKKIGQLIVRIVRNSNYSQADEKMLMNEFKKYVGTDTKIDIEYVSQLNRSKTGKLRFVISDINRVKYKSETANPIIQTGQITVR